MQLSSRLCEVKKLAAKKKPEAIATPQINGDKKRNSALIRELLATSLYTQTKIGQMTGVSRSAVYREIQAMKLEQGE